jgi:hypothetical protein
MIGSKTYAMSNITSVEMGRKDPSGCGPGVLILVGIVMAVGGGVGISENSVGSGAVWLVFGALAIFGGVMASKRAKPTYTVKIGSASGESNIMESRDQPTIQQIVNAINEAIVKRG